MLACLVVAVYILFFASLVLVLCCYHTCLTVKNKTTYSYDHLRSNAGESIFTEGTCMANCNDRLSDKQVTPSRLTRKLLLTDE